MKLKLSLTVGLVLTLLMTDTSTTAFKALSMDSAGQCEISLAEKSKKSRLSISRETDFDYISNPLIANSIYRKASPLSRSMAPSGANGINALWEHKQAKRWHIEAQRNGKELVIVGLIKHDEKAIQNGFKMFDWGFARQAADGSFQGTAGPFHSTSFFVEAVAHTLLVLKQSPQSEKYASQIARYTPLVHRAARWMISSEVWEKGVEYNKRYTHRRYLVASALGLTGKLTGDQELIDYAHRSLEDGLSLQRTDGVNPEKGGYDSSYHMVGVVYAERWVKYFPKDSLTPKVRAMVNKALAWEQTRILPTGEISSEGNSRTAGQETGTLGKVKRIDHKAVFLGFAYWSLMNNNPQYAATSCRIAQYYYKRP